MSALLKLKLLHVYIYTIHCLTCGRVYLIREWLVWVPSQATFFLAHPLYQTTCMSCAHQILLLSPKRPVCHPSSSHYTVCLSLRRLVVMDNQCISSVIKDWSWISVYLNVCKARSWAVARVLLDGRLQDLVILGRYSCASDVYGFHSFLISYC